mmetsp:Transcript_16663/g.23750  ORF Transcript_16663/g.23750 Transcript_16663/m.23750 type:complete len:112 (+) Transcript_16663:301-636(+)
MYAQSKEAKTMIREVDKNCFALSTHVTVFFTLEQIGDIVRYALPEVSGLANKYNAAKNKFSVNDENPGRPHDFSNAISEIILINGLPAIMSLESGSFFINVHTTTREVSSS